MKRDEFIDAMSGIDDRLLDEALELDSADKLKKAENEERARRFSRISKRLSVLAACICLVAVGIFAGGHIASPAGPGTTEPTEIVLTPTPMLYCDSYDEMEKALGYSIPKPESKRADSYIVIMSGDKPESGRIIYTDDSELKIAGCTADISGIFGGRLEGTQEYAGVTVHYYSFGTVRYAIWSDGGFSYSFSADGDDAEKNVYDTAKEIINLLKGQN